MKIKNCPLCGGEATIKEGKRNDANVTYKTKYVQCVGCGTKTQEKISDGYYGLYCTDEEISELWNRREPIDEIVKQLERVKDEFSGGTLQEHYYWKGIDDAIEIVKSGGSNG